MLNQDVNVTFREENNRLTASLSGDVDHHSAFSVRKRIDDELLSKKPAALSLDLSDVTFMDSSGLGLILGRLNKANEIGTVLLIENPSPQIDKILELAGIGRLVQIKRSIKKQEGMKK